MRSQTLDASLTHAMIVGDTDTDLAAVGLVIARIRELLRLIPGEQRRLLGDALLNLAVSIKLRESGTQNTAGILVRLIDSVVESDQSWGDSANRRDSSLVRPAARISLLPA